MNFTDEQASAVLANWYNEGAFSETNRQDSDKFILDDSDTYTYGIDCIGFGIIQWTLKERKERFVEIADEMDSGVGNINVQFALFKDEISVGGICESAWKKVIACNDIESYTKAFLFYIENPEIKGPEEQNKRIGVAKIIYNSMSNKG